MVVEAQVYYWVQLNFFSSIVLSDISIGFEETEMEVYENAGNISLCAGILRPTSRNIIDNVTFYLYLSTKSSKLFEQFL